jgi:hypothetical protein
LQWLSGEAEEHENLEAVRTPNKREEIVSELGAPYLKALLTQEPLVEDLLIRRGHSVQPQIGG